MTVFGFCLQGIKNNYINQYQFAEEALNNLEDINPNGTQLRKQFQKDLLKKCIVDGLEAVNLPNKKG